MEREELGTKEYAPYDLICMNSLNWQKLIYSDRRQINGCLGPRVEKGIDGKRTQGDFLG